MSSTRALVAAAIVLATLSTARAGELTVEPTEPGFTAEVFEFRRVSTRNWIGCWHWDVLQGSGWFPATWHHDVSFTAAGNTQVGELPARSAYEWYCNARVDQYNYVRFTWADPSEPSRLLRGAFSIDVGGTSREAAVQCTVTDRTGTWNNITCDRASLDWVEGADLRVSVSLAP